MPTAGSLELTFPGKGRNVTLDSGEAGKKFPTCRLSSVSQEFFPAKQTGGLPGAQNQSDVEKVR